MTVTFLILTYFDKIVHKILRMTKQKGNIPVSFFIAIRRKKVSAMRKMENTNATDKYVESKSINSV